MKTQATYSKTLIIVLLLLSFIEVSPIIATIIKPNLCYGCTRIGKLHQKLNVNIKLAYINWLAYTVLVIYIVYIYSKRSNLVFKLLYYILAVFMLLLPVMPIANIITFILSAYYDNPPFIKEYNEVFPQSQKIESSYADILSEYNNFSSKDKAECIKKSNPGFTIENGSTDENCWRGLFLKKAGKFDENYYNLFPKTIDCLKDEQIHNAFFSILDPGVEIPGHTGYYKGYLRYHLGVIIPNNNSIDSTNKPYIVCGDEKYYWKNGEGIVFDDMYYHYVKNPSNKTRVVLYLDIKRQTDNKLIETINNIGIWLVENSVFLKFFIKNQHNQIKIES